MASLRVITPGMLTTIQDRGRWGWQSRGVPVAGPMDPYSHRLANALAGNESDAATLEVTLVGPEVEFDDERIVAVAGADFDLTVDGRSTPVNMSFAVRPGSVLRFGARRRGARAYLAIAGGIDVPPVLESRSTHLPSAMGGLEGRPLAGRGSPAPRKKGTGVVFGSENSADSALFWPDDAGENDSRPLFRVARRAGYRADPAGSTAGSVRP